MSDQPTIDPISPETVRQFHQELSGAVLGRVPLELGPTKSSWYPGGKASLRKLTRLESGLQERLASGESVQQLFQGDLTLPDRYRAALRVYDRTGDFGLVLDGLSARTGPRRQLARLVRTSLLYLLLVTVVAALFLAFFANFVVPTIEWMREDLREFAAVDAPMRDESIRWLPAFVVILEIVSLTLLVLLVTGGSSTIASWLGGRRFQTLWASAIAVRAMRALVSAGMSIEEATSVSCDLVGRDKPVGRQVRSAADHCTVEVAKSGHLHVVSNHLKRMAANRLAVLRVLLPVLLVCFVGGAVTLSYCLAIFWPVVTLLKDMSLPGS